MPQLVMKPHKRKIYKYVVPVDTSNPGAFSIEMPKFASFLAMQMKDGRPCLWYQIDPAETEIQTHNFIVVCTGQEFEWPATYLGTFQDGWFVGHIYSVPAKPGDRVLTPAVAVDTPGKDYVDGK